MSDETNDDKIFEDAKNLYNKKEWMKAVELLDALQTNDEGKIAEANRMKAWCFYYLAIKGKESEKMGFLEKAEQHFRLARMKIRQKEGLISVFNGFSQTLWLQGKKMRALEIISKAAEDFPDNASVLNTKSIIYRWKGDTAEAAKICGKVYEIAKNNGDFRTAGHGKQNQGDCFLKLQEKQKTLESYKEAEKMYLKDGNSNFHLESVRKKINNL